MRGQSEAEHFEIQAMKERVFREKLHVVKEWGNPVNNNRETRAFAGGERLLLQQARNAFLCNFFYSRPCAERRTVMSGPDGWLVCADTVR